MFLAALGLGDRGGELDGGAQGGRSYWASGTTARNGTPGSTASRPETWGTPLREKRILGSRLPSDTYVKKLYLDSLNLTLMHHAPPTYLATSPTAPKNKRKQQEENNNNNQLPCPPPGRKKGHKQEKYPAPSSDFLAMEQEGIRPEKFDQ